MSASPASRALSRRALLRAGGASSVVGAVVLGGCDLDQGSASSSAEASRPDPDQHVVDAARRELRGLLMRLSATGETAALVACHRTQLAALQGRPPAETARGRPLTPAQAAVRERRAADRFARWALSCQNGELARVLASVAAGIRMQPVLREVR